jgi:hypothetical protein
MPIVKSRSITPISAKVWIVVMSSIKFNPCGPSSIPASKNPTIEGTFIRPNANITTADITRMSTKDFKKTSSCMINHYMAGLKRQSENNKKL